MAARKKLNREERDLEFIKAIASPQGEILLALLQWGIDEENRIGCSIIKILHDYARRCWAFRRDARWNRDPEFTKALWAIYQKFGYERDREYNDSILDRKEGQPGETYTTTEQVLC